MKYIVGDIVTRDGSDEQEILKIDYNWNLIEVKCIREPRVWGGLSRPWCRLGEEESNVIDKYLFVREHDVIKH